MSEFLKNEIIPIDKKSIDTLDICNDSNSSNHDDNIKDNLDELMSKLELTTTTQETELNAFTDEEILAIKSVYEKLKSDNFPVEKLSWPEIGT
jgi:hypothetical protein